MTSQILIIEDAKDFQFLLRHLLTKEGYTIHSSENGLLALEYLNSVRPLPALILLDLMMPIMDGFEFRAEQLKNPEFAAIPVVVMSAHGHLDIKSQSLSANAFLKKPFEINVLLATIKQFFPITVS